MDWLRHLLGADGGDFYNFWSGLGADLGGLAILGAVIGAYRKHQCHVQGCRRLAKQRVEGTSWVVCHKHHPVGAPTAQDVIDAHNRATNSIAP